MVNPSLSRHPLRQRSAQGCYRFKPWTGPPIASAAEILAHMGEAIADNDLARHIRYLHKIVSAHWSSKESLWSVVAQRTESPSAGRRVWRASASMRCCSRSVERSAFWGGRGRWALRRALTALRCAACG